MALLRAEITLDSIPWVVPPERLWAVAEVSGSMENAYLLPRFADEIMAMAQEMCELVAQKYRENLNGRAPDPV